MKTVCPSDGFLSSRNDARILGGSDCVAGTGRDRLWLCTPAGQRRREALAGHGVMAGAEDFYAVRTIGWDVTQCRRSASELCSLYT